MENTPFRCKVCVSYNKWQPLNTIGAFFSISVFFWLNVQDGMIRIDLNMQEIFVMVLRTFVIKLKSLLFVSLFIKF